MAKKGLFESRNPMMNDEVIKNSSPVLDSELVYSGETMTVDGAVNKTFMLFGIMLLTATFSFIFPNPIFMWGGIIGGAIVSFIIARNLEKSAFLAPLFAALEGLAVGTVTFIYGSMFDGIIFQAVTITLAILFMMLMLYKAGVIKVTERFRSIIMTATGGIMILYLISMVMHFFGMNMPFLHDQSPIGIGISLLIVGVASLKLTVDFDNFYRGAEMKTPSYMEWYFGMGLLFTLIWLYFEILYLLSAFMGSD